jgi:hypothetical protein
VKEITKLINQAGVSVGVALDKFHHCSNVADLLKDALEDIADATAKLEARGAGGINAVEQAANGLCDLLEHEWEQGDGPPEESCKAYLAACRTLARKPKCDCYVDV